jgi:hypothetical protein
MKYFHHSFSTYKIYNEYDINYKISSSTIKIEMVYKEHINQIPNEIFQI